MPLRHLRQPSGACVPRWSTADRPALLHQRGGAELRAGGVKFAANLSMLYPEYGFLDRFGAAAADGFRGVEYVSPYEYPPQLIAELLQRHGLEQVLFNSHAGNWAAGERGLAALVGREAEFHAGIET